MTSTTQQAPEVQDKDLDAINDEELLRNMWQNAEDFSERRKIRARMYRLREQRLREMVQNDEESMGSLTATAEGGGEEEDVVEEVTQTGKERSSRYNKVVRDKLNTESDSSDLISVSRSIPSDDYSFMKNKETRDSVSPVRYQTEELSTEEEAALELERDRIVEALQRAGKTVKVIKSEIPVRRGGGRASPQSRSPPGKKTSPQRKPGVSGRKGGDKQDEFSSLRSYFQNDIKPTEVLVNQEEEEIIDEFGNKVKMIVQTTKDKDGKEFTTRRTAKTTKVVDSESDIDEILIGNPDHEIIDRHVDEEVDKDGSKLKIITETRRRPDGIEYTTKNVLKTSKIFDYDHSEEIDYSEDDMLVSKQESEETDEDGVSIKTVTETRRKKDGTEYVTKKVFRTSKSSSNITPCDDDEVISTKETEEKDDDGNAVRVVIETRRKPTGEQYVYRQVFKCRRMTLSGVELQKGMPMMDNDDEVLSKKEKKERDENGAIVTVVTETRRRKDGSKYTFDYILRSFQGSKSEVSSMPSKSTGATNIKVSDEDELIKEEVKEEEQKDGSIIKTIKERRRAKDGTEYLRHRIMKIPKIPDAKLTVGTLNDEVLENDVEEVEYNGTHIKSITERRRSSLTGLQYTLRRMSKTYQQTRRPSTIPGDEIIDENVTEEEGEEGTVVKTVIRRYQRADGTMYTTHSVKKSFTSPTDVEIEDYCNGELLDQTIDQSETDDGYIVKTVVETYQRTDGVTYTVERSEKISKKDMSDYDKGSVISPSSSDVVLNQEIEEEPDDEGHVIKITTEQRQRPNGSKYTIKSTVIISPTLIPEEETSFVIIKPDDESESEFMPSMDDELVYTRKREEKDHEGNPINVIIETRKSKKTGEKYNVTKRVFTTDILVTNQGQKVLGKKNVKSPSGKSSPSPTKPKADRISSIKAKLSEPKSEPKTKPKEKTRLIRVNTADRRKMFENVDEKNTKNSKQSSTTKERVTSSLRERTDRKLNSTETTARPSDSTTRSKSKQASPSKPAKTDESKPLSSIRKKPLEERKSAPRKQTEPSTDRSSPTSRSSPTKPVTSRTSRTPVQSSPKDANGAGRQCCNRSHGGVDRTQDVPSKRTPTDKTPRKSKESPDDRTARRKELNLRTTKSPVVSLPQTPMTEDVKHKIGEERRPSEPIIEDVSTDSNIKEDRIHRPSLVREPSDYPEMESSKIQDDILDSLEDSIIGNDEEPAKQNGDVQPKKKKPSLESGTEMSSPKMVMRLTSQDNSVDEPTSSSRKNFKPSSKRSSPSKQSSPDRSSRGSSPNAFSKEGSPGRFATGRPVDQGVNSDKIKRLERSLSGKTAYEDLDTNKNQLPGYLEQIESITDLTVLQRMLDDADAYDERRVIRARIRLVKRQGSSISSSTSASVRSTNTTTVSLNAMGRRNLTSSPRPQTTSPTRKDSPTRASFVKGESPTRAVESLVRTAKDVFQRNVSESTTTTTSERRKTSTDRVESSVTSTSRFASRKLSSDEDKLTSTTARTNKLTSTSSVTASKTNEDSVTSKTDESKVTSTSTERKDSIDKSTSSARKTSTGRRSYKRQESMELNIKPQSATKSPRKTSSEKQPPQRLPFGSGRQPSKSSVPSEEPYSEPLRHMKTPNKRTPGVSNAQTDVEKIVSPYGVGPTDENGLPLIGLRALKKRRQQQPTAPAPDITPSSPVKEQQPYEPTDSSGKPLFGLKALKAKNTTATQEETTESTRKESIKSVSTVSSTQRSTSRTEERDDADSATASAESSSCESEPETESQPEECLLQHHEDEDFTSLETSTERRAATTTTEEVIGHRSKPLKDIIKLHETIVKDSPEPKVDPTSSPKPRQKLRNTFEPKPEAVEPKTPHRTWDVGSDLATRAVNMKNVINKHESIGKESSPEPVKATTTPVKLSSILKNKTDSVEETRRTETSVSETSVDTNAFMEDMSEEQITKLSEEFDRRVQVDEDERIERQTSPARETSKSEAVRKTSYTEIKLSSPQKKEPSSPPPSDTGHTTFINSRAKVTGMSDVISRMGGCSLDGTDQRSQDASTDAQEQSHALSTLNRFLGAQVLLSGVESMLATSNGNGRPRQQKTSTVKKTVTSMDGGKGFNSTSTRTTTSSYSTSNKSSADDTVKGVRLSSVTDRAALQRLLDSCDAYDDRRMVRQRLKNLSANAKGSSSVVASGEVGGGERSTELRSSDDLNAVNSWLDQNFPTERNGGETITRTTKTGPRHQVTKTVRSVHTIESSNKGSSPFDKFQQLDSQFQGTRRASGGGASKAQLFSLSSSLKSSANSIKDVLLQWCQCRTRDYKGIKIENFSTSWNDGMAFCALIHHFYPDAFDFDKLDPRNRRYNFDLAFKTADERAGVMALLDVDDMVAMKKPDWKCVFTYIQSLYKRLKDE